MKKNIYLSVFLAFCLLVFGAAAQDNGTAADTLTVELISTSNWLYNSDTDVYYQLGIPYVGNVTEPDYQTLAVFVPGAYFTAEDNGDGTYSVEITESATVGNYSALNAPYVIPVNTAGYRASEALVEYSDDVNLFMEAGIIYIYAGCRGREQGAPAGVTDLKAAIRYIRGNKDVLPGNTDSFYSFGMSGGGAQSALLGVTGDSDLYTPYLEAAGAFMDESDALAGSMCWCPVTNLDVADAAYEWNMGYTRKDLTEEEQSLSDNLALVFADYINAVGFVDENGNPLTLEESETGIYQAGSYHDYIKAVIESAFEDFAQDVVFPYEVQASYRRDGSKRPPSGDLDLEGTYNDLDEYLTALNQNGEWITYDSESGKCTITNVASFVRAFKHTAKGLGAFDDLNYEQGESLLFGQNGSMVHFNPVLAELVSDEYAAAFEADLQTLDFQGNTIEERMNMYNPVYFLSNYYEGAGTSTVAPQWRIRSGINQSDTALCTEINLALALANAGYDVDFATVWAQGHVTAERTGEDSANASFIEWVAECEK